jgi:hypothetical protein
MFDELHVRQERIDDKYWPATTYSKHTDMDNAKQTDVVKVKYCICTCRSLTPGENLMSGVLINFDRRCIERVFFAVSCRNTARKNHQVTE